METFHSIFSIFEGFGLFIGEVSAVFFVGHWASILCYYILKVSEHGISITDIYHLFAMLLAFLLFLF